MTRTNWGKDKVIMVIKEKVVRTTDVFANN